MFAPVSCKKFVLFLETQGFVTSFVCALQLQILAVLGPDLTLSRPRSRAAAAPCLSPGPLCCHLPAATCFNPRSGEELGLANPLILPLGYVILGGSCQRGEMEASQGQGAEQRCDGCCALGLGKRVVKRSHPGPQKPATCPGAGSYKHLSPYKRVRPPGGAGHPPGHARIDPSLHLAGVGGRVLQGAPERPCLHPGL